MPAVTDPDLALFSRDDFERAWQVDTPAPCHPPILPDTAIIVKRCSPHDFQDRQIYLWVDEQELGKIRYGQRLNIRIEPGRHTVRVFNTLFTRTLTFDVAPGEQVHLACGNGMPTAGWLMMIFLHVTYLRVWLEREASDRSAR